MILFYIILISFLQDSDYYKNIDSNVNQIDSDLSQYEQSKSLNLFKYQNDIEEISSVLEVQSISLFSYSDKNEIKKIVVTYAGIKQDSESSYYFKSSQLVYVYKKQIDYESYKSDKHFDAKKYTISENSYYLKDQKLLRWLNPDKRIIESPLIIMKTQEAILNNDISIYLKQLN